MKFGVQIAITDDGAWSVSQLKQETNNGPYTRVQRSVVFISHDSPLASQKLLDAIDRGLRGKLKAGARSA